MYSPHTLTSADVSCDRPCFANTFCPSMVCLLMCSPVSSWSESFCFLGRVYLCIYLLMNCAVVHKLVEALCTDSSPSSRLCLGALAVWLPLSSWELSMFSCVILLQEGFCSFPGVF